MFIFSLEVALLLNHPVKNQHTYEALVIQAQQSETYEFLDIEFDPETKVFYLHDYYKHE